jgi:microcystin-dependent protein
MPLENLTGSDKFVNALVETNPVGSSDFISDGDNHIRGIKNVLKNTFPNVTGAITAAQEKLNYLTSAAAFMGDILAAADLAALKVLLAYGSAADEDVAASGTGDLLREDGDGSGLTGVGFTGDIHMTFKTTAPTGWLLLNGATVGDASSGATHASADNEALFLHLWDNIVDTYAPVVTGRGATAAADWAAHKRITLPNGCGRSPLGAGTGSGLTPRSVGETGGFETHTLTNAELPTVTIRNPSVTESPAFGDAGSAPVASDSNTTFGSDDPHNNMHPWIAFNYIIKV